MENTALSTASLERPVTSSVLAEYGATACANNVESIAALNKRFGPVSLPYFNYGGYQSGSWSSASTNLYAPPLSRSKDSFGFYRYNMGGGMDIETVTDPEKPHMIQRLEYFLNVVNHVCIGFTTIYMSWLCLRINLAGTALHAWLATIGFCFLMAEAIMCHYSGNVLTFNYKRNTKTTIHWVLQVLGGGLGVAGTLIKLIQKGFLIKTTHGKLGFAALILCILSMLSGLLALYSMRFKRTLNPLLNKTFHVLLGTAIFSIAMLAQFYGYQTGFFRRNNTVDFQVLMKSLTLISLVLCVIGPLQALYQKTRNILRNFN